MRCSASFCPNTIQSTGRDFQRCGRCNIALYCGRTCQINSWEDNEFPHKLICTILRSLVERGGGEELVFRYPIPNDPRHFPSELSDIVISNWENASVALKSPLECVTLWVNHLMTSGPVKKKSECAPGFDDYDALVADLAGTNAARQGMSIIAFCWLSSFFFHHLSWQRNRLSSADMRNPTD